MCQVPKQVRKAAAEIMKPENFRHVRKLWRMYNCQYWANVVESREWIFADKPYLSHLEWDVETFNEPTAQRVMNICEAMWKRHQIAAIWYVKASKTDGLVTIVIS